MPAWFLHMVRSGCEQCTQIYTLTLFLRQHVTAGLPFNMIHKVVKLQRCMTELVECGASGQHLTLRDAVWFGVTWLAICAGQ